MPEDTYFELTLPASNIAYKNDPTVEPKYTKINNINDWSTSFGGVSVAFTELTDNSPMTIYNAETDKTQWPNQIIKIKLNSGVNPSEW